MTWTPTPKDWQNPEWDVYDMVHGWRNYVSDEVRLMWETFTDEQKQAIARMAHAEAMREDWD